MTTAEEFRSGIGLSDQKASGCVEFHEDQLHLNFGMLVDGFPAFFTMIGGEKLDHKTRNPEEEILYQKIVAKQNMLRLYGPHRLLVDPEQIALQNRWLSHKNFQNAEIPDFGWVAWLPDRSLVAFCGCGPANEGRMGEIYLKGPGEITDLDVSDAWMEQMRVDVTKLRLQPFQIEGHSR